MMSREADVRGLLQLIAYYLVMLWIHLPTQIKGTGRAHSLVMKLKFKVLKVIGTSRSSGAGENVSEII